MAGSIKKEKLTCRQITETKRCGYTCIRTLSFEGVFSALPKNKIDKIKYFPVNNEEKNNNNMIQSA